MPIRVNNGIFYFNNPDQAQDCLNMINEFVGRDIYTQENYTTSGRAILRLSNSSQQLSQDQKDTIYYIAFCFWDSKDCSTGIDMASNIWDGTESFSLPTMNKELSPALLRMDRTQRDLVKTFNLAVIGKWCFSDSDEGVSFISLSDEWVSFILLSIDRLAKQVTMDLTIISSRYELEYQRLKDVVTDTSFNWMQTYDEMDEAYEKHTGEKDALLSAISSYKNRASVLRSVAKTAKEQVTTVEQLTSYIKQMRPLLEKGIEITLETVEDFREKTRELEIKSKRVIGVNIDKLLVMVTDHLLESVDTTGWPSITKEIEGWIEIKKQQLDQLSTGDYPISKLEKLYLATTEEAASYCDSLYYEKIQKELSISRINPLLFRASPKIPYHYDDKPIEELLAKQLEPLTYGVLLTQKECIITLEEIKEKDDEGNTLQPPVILVEEPGLYSYDGLEQWVRANRATFGLTKNYRSPAGSEITWLKKLPNPHTRGYYFPPLSSNEVMSLIGSNTLQLKVPEFLKKNSVRELMTYYANKTYEDVLGEMKKYKKDVWSVLCGTTANSELLTKLKGSKLTFIAENIVNLDPLRERLDSVIKSLQEIVDTQTVIKYKNGQAVELLALHKELGFPSPTGMTQLN